MYLNGAMLDTFVAAAGAAKTLNADGTLTMTGANGAFIHKKGLNFVMGDTNKIEIRAKLSLNGGMLNIRPFGTYTENGEAKEITDYGAVLYYRGVSANKGWTCSAPDDDGFVTIVFDLAYTKHGEAAQDVKIDIVKGFRLDIIGGTAENYVVIDYVKAI